MPALPGRGLGTKTCSDWCNNWTCKSDGCLGCSRAGCAKEAEPEFTCVMWSYGRSDELGAYWYDYCSNLVSEDPSDPYKDPEAWCSERLEPTRDYSKQMQWTQWLRTDLKCCAKVQHFFYSFLGLDQFYLGCLIEKIDM